MAAIVKMAEATEMKHTESEVSSSLGLSMARNNIRIAVVGNVDAGKSTLIGTLTSLRLDDGRGSSRSLILKHQHEIETGRTSTISSHLLGFKETGDCVATLFSGDEGKKMKYFSMSTNKNRAIMPENEVVAASSKVVTLTDLAGHEKYLKTTIHGISSGMVDYALVLVNASQPPTHMTQHHLNLCSAYGIPVLIVLTKIDMCPKHVLKTTKEEISEMVRSPEVGKRLFTVRNEKDIETIKDKLMTLAPVVTVSSVTGEGLDLLSRLLFFLPKRRRHWNKVSRPFELLVEDVFNVPGVGPVVSGFVNAGTLHVGDSVFVGPLHNGSYMKTVVKSAHMARTCVDTVTSGQSASLALASLSKQQKKKLRRGMVVVQEASSCRAYRLFDAEICVLRGEGTTIRTHYKTYVHILHVRQAASVVDIELLEEDDMMNLSTATCMPELDGIGGEDGVVLRPGLRAKVRFKLLQQPEYLRPNMRVLFRDGHVRGVGIIKALPEDMDTCREMEF